MPRKHALRRDIYTSQIISIKEARKLLGSSAERISDDQVGEIIDTLHLMARKYLSNPRSKNISGVLESN